MNKQDRWPVTEIMIGKNVIGLLAAAVLLLSPHAEAQDQTVGLFLNDSLSYDGYTLFAPMKYSVTYLIDNDGLLVHLWESDFTPALSAYLLESGNLLRTCQLTGNPAFNAGGSGGRVEERDWEGTMVWEFEYSTAEHLLHHDVEVLPNGNVLMIAWEHKSSSEATAAGRRPGLLSDGELWPDHIIEVEPTGASGGNIVWEWHVWDHLIQDYDPTKANYGVVADHPELVDVNYVRGGPGGGNADWTHINSVDYNDQFDQIILSAHSFDEIWIIDHSTTTEEAAGHAGGNSGKGGDLLYRWGNPQTYDAGSSDDQLLFAQHDARWIESGYPGEGDILVFNNGRGRPGGDYSTVDEITPPVDSTGSYTIEVGSAYGPEEQTWVYTAENPTDFYSQNISGADRLPNGNTLICNGTNGIFFEVTPDSEIVWLYVNPVTGDGPLEQGDAIPGGPMGQENLTFRACRYPETFPGFSGRDLTPGCPVEGGADGVEEVVGTSSGRFVLHQNKPNPFDAVTAISFTLPKRSQATLKVFNAVGERVGTLLDAYLPPGDHQYHWRADTMPSGVYFCTLEDGTHRATVKVLLLR